MSLSTIVITQGLGKLNVTVNNTSIIQGLGKLNVTVNNTVIIQGLGKLNVTVNNTVIIQGLGKLRGGLALFIVTFSNFSILDDKPDCGMKAQTALVN